MKAVLCREYGSPEVLVMEEINKPEPKDNEILVKVYASSVTSGVSFIRKGKHPDSRFFTFMLRIMLGFNKPRKSILGYELAGKVESVGKNVTLFNEGDEIFGTTTGLKMGSYAQYVCLPEKWKSGVVAKKPENLSYEESAVIPVGGMTALFNLDKANIQKGQKVLIYGASGSVGTYAVQIAKNSGAEVTGVCSTVNLELVKSIGADKVIDYTSEDFTKQNVTYDVIFDAVGKLSKSHSKISLRKYGMYLSTNVPTKEVTDDLLYLKELSEKGKLKPVIDKTYSLEEIVAAHTYVDGGHKKGNVAITIKH